jgi:hypothetical protein
LTTLFTEQIIITIQIKKTLGWAPEIIFLNNKGICSLSSDIFCAHLSWFHYVHAETNRLTKIFPNLDPLSGIDHRSWTRQWHTTLSSNQTKNNKQKEVAMRSWKHRPHSWRYLWSHTSLFNADVLLFLPYDPHAAACRWSGSKGHCVRTCSLDMKKENVNEWNKMSNPLRFFKNKSKQTRSWILLGVMCVRELN